jgi:RhtB (resistance to homoserine/threonine) family protein
MELVPFLLVSAVVIASPGPDTALVVRNALFGGRRLALATSLGVSCGLAVWSLAAAIGVAAVLRRSEPAFTALKVIGALYLVWLGIQALRLAWSGREPELAPGPAHPVDARRGLSQGFLSNLSNPKIAVFFTSFLPQFAPADANVAVLLALGLVFCLLTLAWLAGYSVAVARAGDVLRRRRVRQALESVTGAVLIAFGIRLATSEH